MDPQPVHPTVPAGLPDLHHLLACAISGCPPTEDDYSRIIGCALREVGRLRPEFPFLDATEMLRGPFVHLSGLPGEIARLVGVRLNMPPQNGPHALPALWLAVLPQARENPPEAVLIAAPSRESAVQAFHIMGRHEVLRFLTERWQVSLHAAAQKLFLAIQTTFSSLDTGLVAQANQRLRVLNRQLVELFKQYQLPW